MSSQFHFRKSTLCNGEDSGCGCVEVATNQAEVIAVRDTKTGGTLEFTPHEWAGFIAGAKAGQFDIDFQI
jgi:hypothetical protein